jgi:hypothetical protein
VKARLYDLQGRMHSYRFMAWWYFGVIVFVAVPGDKEMFLRVLDALCIAAVLTALVVMARRDRNARLEARKIGATIRAELAKGEPVVIHQWDGVHWADHVDMQEPGNTSKPGSTK